MSAFRGGFITTDMDLITQSGSHRHHDGRATSDFHLSAVNRMGAVPFRVNTNVLDLLVEAFEAQDTLNGLLPEYAPEPMPPRMDDAVWSSMSEEERQEYRARRADIHARNLSAEGRRSARIMAINLAGEYAGYEKHWHVPFCDFRLRVYYATSYLNPQGDDVSRALLTFGEGKPLGRTGLYWLGVRLANAAGQDKLPLDERVAWAYDHHDDICRSALDPWGHRWWADPDFDEPFNLLATCFEWERAHRLEDPGEFVSFLPVPQDGSINGCQHLSLMGHDPVGARMTNCSSDRQRHDLYQDVADRVAAMVSHDAVLGIPEAQAWAGRVSRKTVKRGVMTTPYGVTPRGITDQLVSDGFASHIQDHRERWQSANYLQEKISTALGEAMSKGRDIMAYLQGVAHTLAQTDTPLTWTVPTGSRITQAYHRLTATRVNTVLGRFQLFDEDPDAGLLANKCALAAAPNVIHSMDAAMLATVVNRLHDRGVTSFWGIHDSYAVHAADTATLRATLKDTAVEMYSGDYLADFHREVLSYAPDPSAIPTPPDQGDFDVLEVLESEYFFS